MAYGYIDIFLLGEQWNTDAKKAKLKLVAACL
jgi:hypothetical protein